MKIEVADNEDVLPCNSYFVYERCEFVKERLDGSGRWAVNYDNTHRSRRLRLILIHGMFLIIIFINVSVIMYMHLIY